MGTLNRRVLPAALKALKKYTDSQVAALPVAITGEVKMWAGSGTPTGYLLCDGSAVSRTTYSALFAALGTTYGAGDGSTTFNLPTFVSKFPRGNTQGTGGGADTHTHTSAAHTHTLTSGTAYAHVTSSGATIYRDNFTVPSWTDAAAVTATSSSTPATAHVGGAGVGGSTDSATPAATGSASNIPAYTGVAFIIKT